MPDQETRVCPRCSLVHPASAVLCDCGYAFDEAGAQAAREAGFRPHHETHPLGPGTKVKVGAALLGFLLGAAPLFLNREIREVLVSGGEWRGPAIVLAAVLGFAGSLIAVFAVLRWHAHRAKHQRQE